MKKALLIVDVQTALVEGAPFACDQMLARIAELLAQYRKVRGEVIYVRHDGGPGDELERGCRGWEIHEAVAPLKGEPVFDKWANSAFLDTGLQEYLEERGIDRLVLVGMQTEYCMDATCKSAFERGFHVTIPQGCFSTCGNQWLTGEEINAFYTQIWDGRFAKVLPWQPVQPGEETRPWPPNGRRQAVVGLPDVTFWLICDRVQAGDAVLCFDEYVPYFSQWYETYGYGSIDNRSGELERMTCAAAPLLDRPGLWVMCAPVGEVGMAQGRWLEERGCWLADLRPKVAKSATPTARVPIYSAGNPPDLETRWRAAEAHITPGPVKTEGEMIAWLKEERGVVEFTPLPHQRDKIRLNVLLNLEPSSDHGDAWARRDDLYARMYEAPETLPPMEVRGFRLPWLENQKGEAAEFLMDAISGHGAAECNVGTLFEEMALYKGVTQEDIRTRSVRFMSYVSAMEALGRWNP